MSNKDSSNSGKTLHNPKSNVPALYVPCWLSQVHKKLLTCGAKLVYGRLAQWSTSTGDVFRSVPQLSIEVGLPERNIERHIKELKDVGLIGTYHPQAGGVNHFHFYDHEWMHIPICQELCYQTNEITPPAKNGGGVHLDPPPKMAVPPAKNGGTLPPKMADINKKEIKRNTTTTVVVEFDQIKPKNPTPKTPLSVVISIQADDRLLTAYRATPIDSPYFITENDFLMCCKWHIEHREEEIHENGRIKAMIGWIKKGTFEIPKEWIKSRGKINKTQEQRECIQQEASLKKYEEDMKEYKSRPKKDIELLPQKTKSTIPALEFKVKIPQSNIGQQ